MPARVYSPTPANLRRLAAALRRGELVAFPTETVYGLAAHALDARACRAIFRAKGRPAHDPLIVHVANLAHAEELAGFNDLARKLARRFWPGPLTLVLPKKPCVPGIVTAGRRTVAIRSPAHPLARRLLRLSGLPLAAPSANAFGYISPTSAAHVLDGLGKKIPHILDGGPCLLGVESTILDLTNPARPKILRPGVITAEMLEKFLGRPFGPTPRNRSRAKQTRGMLAPGLLPQHYSPHTPLVIKHRWTKLPPEVAGIFLRKPPGRTAKNIYWLSDRSALADMARNLYRVLRQADRGRHRQIWIEAPPDDSGGLAAAITDRLRRAAKQIVGRDR
jgi:L-threonylcarbamoyladenylate synthase